MILQMILSQAAHPLRSVRAVAAVAMRAAVVTLGIASLSIGRIEAAGAGQSARIAPPPGIQISAETRAELERAAVSLGREVEFLAVRLREQPRLLELLPDVRILHKAVDWALRHDEFLRSNDVTIARQLLVTGQQRCAQLREGQAPWTAATGLVVRGYISKVDGSVQPYGLVVPSSWATEKSASRRLDVWLHGRDNLLTELKFLTDRQRSVGEFAPPDTLVLHPYGRYCNAFKFAGEVDVFEGIEAVQRHYRIDPNRVAIRGFSMGGAGCWHLATHHAGFWAAAAPGAGFAETPHYTGVFGRVPWPREFEQRLWNWYDATPYALNLQQCPTIAYSGELDKQKQAADAMAAALHEVGLELTHIIGAGTEHRYEPKAKLEVARRVDEAVASGRSSSPDEVRLVTWTLRYNRMHWVTIEGLDEHWKRSTVVARRLNGGIVITTENVSRLTVAREGPLAGVRSLNVLVDGIALTVKTGRDSGAIHLQKRGERWASVNPADDRGLRKRPGLQGPIDDAFMDSFLFVRPTGRSISTPVADWVTSALARATNEWRAQFRGDAPIKDDVDVTPVDIASRHLILWGDSASNKLLAKLINDLPLRWNRQRLELGNRGFPADRSIPILIYPNPLNPARYVVLNSGFTFWKAGDASNAQQTPKLPDFAVVDLNVPQGQIPTRGLILAGFFDENWGMK